MTDRELLELAAKAAGIAVIRSRLGDPLNEDMLVVNSDRNPHYRNGPWNPLTDDGDALRLAVKLNLDIRYESYDAGCAVIVAGAWDDAPEGVHEIFEHDGPRAVRLAITRAAAELGKAQA